MDKPKRVSLTDIARACEVSIATVSYVLNDAPGHAISAETRRKILETADRLGYVPNSAAKALRVGRTQITLLDTSVVMEGTVGRDFARAFSDRLHSAGITVITRSRPDTPLSRIAVAVSPFAVATLWPLADRDVAQLRHAGVKYIAGVDFGRRSDIVDTEWLVASSREQVRYLASVGHTHLAYANTTDPALREFLVYRRNQILEYVRALELPPPVEFDVPDDPDAATQALAGLRERAPDVTAIAAANDETAFPVLAAAYRLGIRVPEELAVIGFDDVPLARHACPALTTVRIEGEQLGDALAVQLLNAAGLPVDATTVAGPNFALVVRASA